jgi:hypothetical protein
MSRDDTDEPRSDETPERAARSAGELPQSQRHQDAGTLDAEAYYGCLCESCHSPDVAVVVFPIRPDYSRHAIPCGIYCADCYENSQLPYDDGHGGELTRRRVIRRQNE